MKESSLLSIDPFYEATEAFDLTLRVTEEGGTQRLKLLDNAGGDEVASVALSDLAGPVRIVGSPFDDTLRLDSNTSSIRERIP